MSNSLCQLDTLVVVTADRPALLRRCLDSYAAHFAEWGRQARAVVIDMSRVESEREATALGASAAARPHFEVAYVGRDARARFRRQAVSGGADPAAVEWLLGGRHGAKEGAGIGRNYALLSASGNAALMADDDTECRPWQGGSTADIALVGHVDPNVVVTFANRRAALDAVGPGAVDLCAAHEQLLGRPIHDLFAFRAGERRLEGACSRLQPALDGCRPDWKVRAVWSGLAGDCGSATPLALLFAQGATRERLAAHRDLFRTALTSRAVVRHVGCATVGDEPWFMTYAASVDTSTLVPPFSPCGANEDGLFARMLRACCGGFVAQVPVGVLHDPPRANEFRPDWMRTAASPRLNDVLRLFVMDWESRADEKSRNCGVTNLGLELAAHGRLGARAWKSRLGDVLAAHRRGLVMTIDVMLSSGFAYPCFWIDAFEAYRRTLLAAASKEKASIPVEYRRAGSMANCAEAVQRYVTRFGHALIGWPTLWDYSRSRSGVPR